MNLKTYLSFSLAVLLLAACNNKSKEGTFTLNGQVKNIPDQQVYLEQLYFSQQDPQVLDTADVKGGKFELSSAAAEEGLYRIRFEKMNSGFVFINDKDDINFTADIN